LEKRCAELKLRGVATGVPTLDDKFLDTIDSLCEFYASSGNAGDIGEVDYPTVIDFGEPPAAIQLWY
jgi:hypothetical protein